MYHLKQEKNNLALSALTKKIRCAGAFAFVWENSRLSSSLLLAKRPLRQGATRGGTAVFAD